MIHKMVWGIIRITGLLALMGSAGCSLIPSKPFIDESVTALLAAYSRDLSDGAVSDPSSYSLQMQALVQERRLFYNEFFLNALHSDVISITSSYEIRSISEDPEYKIMLSVKAVELVESTAKYRLEQDGHPMIKAAKWAIEHTDDRKIKMELQTFASMINTASYRHSTEGYQASFVLEHTLVIVRKWNGFQLIQDSYTDANPQDNPDGTDVIKWQDGAFSRQEPDYSFYPDYSMYHTAIEVLGKRLLDDYSR